MSLVPMPNGEVVDIADGTPADVIEKIKKQYPATSRKGAVASGASRVDMRNYGSDTTDQRKEVLNRADTQQRLASGGITNTGEGVLAALQNGFRNPLFSNLSPDQYRGYEQGQLLSFGDELKGAVSAGTKGVYSAITKGDIGEIGKEYTTARDTDRELNRRSEQDSPIGYNASNIAGSLIVPVGGELKGVGKAGELLSRAGLDGVGSKLVSLGDKSQDFNPIVKAIIAGGKQGGLNAAGQSDNLASMPGDTLAGTALGAIGGGAVGGAAHLGARGVQILKDALPQNAQRTAMTRIASLLDNAKMSPDAARNEIAATDAAGGDAMVQDLTPGLRAQAASISRKPNVPSSNELIDRGEQRIADRRANFSNQVQDASGINKDAFERGDELSATRKEAGQEDYAKDGVMDKPLQWNEDLDKFFRDAPEPTQQALRGAYNDMLARRENPATMLKLADNGNVEYVPNMRTFDYMKRRFNTDIGQALGSGDRPKAQALSGELSQLKDLLGKANPEYADVLATQRDLFQKQKSLEIGQTVLRRLGTEPRAVVRELGKLRPEDAMDARIGIVDALVNSDTKADPVSVYTNIARNPAQKKVLEFAFGGKGNLGRFDKWVTREIRARRADVLTAPGRQSETSRIALANDEDSTHIGGVLNTAMRGYAFGGVIGAASGAVRTLGNIATGTNKLVQEEIAKILLSKGDGLEKGISAAQQYAQRRAATNAKRAVTFSRAGAQAYSNALGN